MATTTLKNKTHARFYCLLKQLPGYSAQNAASVKESIVDAYSEGRTSSLSEFYSRWPGLYERMIADLKSKTENTPSHKRANVHGAEDIWRKRVLAAVCSWMDRSGRVFASDYLKLRYAQTVACRAANCANFNKISETRLAEIYNAFINKADVLENLSKLDQDAFLVQVEKAVKQIRKQHNF